MRHPFRLLLLLTLVATLGSLALPRLALAHERRPIAGGKYQLVVGFLTEPAFAGEMNGISLAVTIPGENNKPVEGLEKTVKAEVMTGGGAHSMPVQLQTRYGLPGSYAGHFMPTTSGSYFFHFTGTIEGAPLDETFESGPGRFNDVQSIQPLQFPDKLSDPAVAASELRAARADADFARNLAIIGLAAGAIGLAVGIASLVDRRRRRAFGDRGPVIRAG